MSRLLVLAFSAFTASPHPNFLCYFANIFSLLDTKKPGAATHIVGILLCLCGNQSPCLERCAFLLSINTGFHPLFQALLTEICLNHTLIYILTALLETSHSIMFIWGYVSQTRPAYSLDRDTLKQRCICMGHTQACLIPGPLHFGMHGDWQLCRANVEPVLFIVSKASHVQTSPHLSVASGKWFTMSFPPVFYSALSPTAALTHRLLRRGSVLYLSL